MANIDVKKQQNQQEQTGLTRRGSYFPSLFSLGNRDLFTSSPFELMRQFTEEMDRAFEDFGLWGEYGGSQQLQRTRWSPAIEILERDEKLLVRAELPGLSKQDVKVEMTDDALIIQGERKQEHEEKREGFYRSERRYGHFYRTIPLPEGVNTSQVNAQFNNGVLEISIPIPEGQKRRRNVPIEITGGHEPRSTAQYQTAGSQAAHAKSKG